MPKRALNPQRFRPLCETAAEAGRDENRETLQPLPRTVTRAPLKQLYRERLAQGVQRSSRRVSWPFISRFGGAQDHALHTAETRPSRSGGGAVGLFKKSNQTPPRVHLGQMFGQIFAKSGGIDLPG